MQPDIQPVEQKQIGGKNICVCFALILFDRIKYEIHLRKSAVIFAHFAAAVQTERAFCSADSQKLRVN
jgi:hypothetical protein